MREKLIHIGEKLWKYADSHIGAALFTGAATYVTYVLTLGSFEQELMNTKKKLDQSADRLRIKESEMNRVTEEVRDLLHSKMEVGFKLSTCQLQRNFYQYAHENSWCFFRQHYSDKTEGSTIKIELEREKQTTSVKR